MRNKKDLFRTKLSSDKAPVLQSDAEPPKPKLGFIHKKQTIMRTYKLRVEAIDAAAYLKKELSGMTNVRLSVTQIIEALLINAAKKPERMLKIIGKRI